MISAPTRRQNSSSGASHDRCGPDARPRCKHRADLSVAQRRQEPLEAWAVDATARTAQVIVDDDDIAEAELPRSLHKPVLASLALGVDPPSIAARIRALDARSWATRSWRRRWSIASFTTATSSTSVVLPHVILLPVAS